MPTAIGPASLGAEFFGLPGAARIGQLSGDGSAVVGMTDEGGLFRWTRDSGVVDLALPNSVLSDLTVPVYYMPISRKGDAIAVPASGGIAFWRQDAGWDHIPVPTGNYAFPRYASPDLRLIATQNSVVDSQDKAITLIEGHPYGLSDDGKTVLTGQEFGIWTEETGLVRVPNARVFFTYHKERQLSVDGRVAVGFTAGVMQEAIRWTRDRGVQRLGFLPGRNQSQSVHVTADGKSLFGYSWHFNGSTYTNFEMFRWTEEEGMIGLGYAPGDTSVQLPIDTGGISADGMFAETVAFTQSGYRIFLWRDGIGMRTLESVLRDGFGLGDAIQGWQLSAGPQGIANFSDDGFVMAGRGLNPSGVSQVWVADLRTLAEWSQPGGAMWHTPGNWAGNVVPHNNVGMARLWTALSADGTVDIGATDTVVRSISFKNDDASYNVVASAGGRLVLESKPGTASIVYEHGNLKDHSISAPITLASNTVIDIPLPHRSLTISGPLSGSGVTLTKTGAGLVSVRNLRARALSLDGGAVSILPNGVANDTSVIAALSIAGTPSAPTAVLDLTNNALIIDYTGTSPSATVRQQIVAGRGGPGLGKTWNGTGITSSAAAAANAIEPESRSIGYAENATLPLGPYTNFRGQPVDDTSVLMAFTRTGDVNLDGIVDDNDVTIIGATYAPGVPQPSWALGDIDYNGFVDDDDVTLLGVFYDPSAPPLTAAVEGISGVAEPGAWALAVCALAALALGAVARRRAAESVRLCLLSRSERAT
ncbi:MAG: hypothetical protein WD894_23680 [Pirellulales bacterium]